jgi:hypothetical protein
MFSEGFHYPSGPLKGLTSEQKEKVHILAEIRLEELEETG